MTAQHNLLAITTTRVAEGRLTVTTTRSYSSSNGISARITTPAISELLVVAGATGSGTKIATTTLNIRAEAGAVLTLSGTTDSLALTASAGALLSR